MTPPKPKPRTTRWTKADQLALKAWEKKHPFPPGSFSGGGSSAAKPKPRTTRVYPGNPMRRAGGSARPIPGTPLRRAGGGRHGLAVTGMPLCAATAVAESLLAATGFRADEDDILRLHEAAGGDGSGASLAAVLAAAAQRGLAGYRADVAACPVADGTVVSLALELAQEAQPAWDVEQSPFWGLHAAYLTAGHVLTWGKAIPATEAFLERQTLGAWQICWG